MAKKKPAPVTPETAPKLDAAKVLEMRLAFAQAENMRLGYQMQLQRAQHLAALLGLGDGDSIGPDGTVTKAKTP